MSVRNLSTIDRDMFQSLGRLLQEAFAEGLDGNVPLAPNSALTCLTDHVLVNSVISGKQVRINNKTFYYQDTFETTEVDISADTITISSSLGGCLKTGSKVRVSSTGTLPGGLAAATDYYVIKVSSTSIKLATSEANAIAGTAINLTSVGSGTHTVYTQDSLIGFQCKPRAGATMNANIYGAEFEPGLNSGVAGTGLVGVASRPVLKGSAGGDLSGDVRCYEGSLGSDASGGRTISGVASYLWCDANWSGCTITGGVAIIHMPATAADQINWLALLQADDTIAANAGSPASLPANTGYIRVKIGSVIGKIAIYAD